MTVESRTLGDLVSRVSFILTNSATAPTALATEIKWALNWAMRELFATHDFPSFKVETTLSTANGTADYALPDDFVKIIEPGLYFDASPRETLHYYEEQDRVELGLMELYSTARKPEWWTIRGRSTTTGAFQLRLLPTPDATYSIRYTYYAHPALLAGQADGTEIDRRYPREMDEALVTLAALNPQFTAYLLADQQQTLFLKYQKFIQDVPRRSRPVVGIAHYLKAYRSHGGQGHEYFWPYPVTGTVHHSS